MDNCSERAMSGKFLNNDNIRMAILLLTILGSWWNLSSEISRQIDRVDRRLDTVDRKLERIDERLDSFGERIAANETRLSTEK